MDDLTPVTVWLLYPDARPVDISDWSIAPQEGECVQSMTDMTRYHTVTGACWAFGVDAVGPPTLNIHLGPAHERAC